MQKHSKMSRVIAVVLTALMVLTVLPIAASAAVERTEHSLTIASTTKTALAPGVTETSVVSYDKNGKRVQYFVVDCDVNNGTTQVKANYHDNDNTGVWGKATVVEQANAAKAKRGYNVVATTNAAYYNVTTGQPTGAFVMEGVNINGTATGNSYQFFAQLDDGSYVIGDKGEFGNYADHVVEAVGGHLMLVKNGAVIAGLDAVNKYPRSTVGLKEDGSVVLMLADGNNQPYSIGLTYAEQAQLMLELGCVDAIELDGGGSATYAAKPEGADEIEVRNVCCDGTVRSVSNTLMVISTAVADGTFDHANLSTEYAYYAPNSDVEIGISGADAAGGPADLPEGIAWGLSDDSFGTVADGVFTSNGTLGTVTVNALYEGEVVGSIDVTVVNPDSIAFSASEKTVPYGKSADFSVNAMYNGAEMFAPASAYDFTMTAGTMDGFMYYSPDDETIPNGTVTATYKYASLDPITVAVTFGKGSEVLFDFEDGDVSEWKDWRGMEEAIANGELEEGCYTMPYKGVETNWSTAASNNVAAGIKEGTFLATRENGKVHSGDYALGYTFDYTQGASFQNWMYGYLYYTGETKVLRDVANGINGTRIGMWMYIPEEAVGSCSRLAYTYKSGDTLSTAYLYFTYQYVKKGFSKLTSDKIPESGWAYVYCDLDDISTTYVTTSYYKKEDGTLTRAAASNYAPAFIQWIVSSSAKGAENVTFYIDDITLDYSDVVDDRDAPVISNPLALDDLNAYTLNGSAVNTNVLSFTADAVEDTTHNPGNATGIDGSSAKVYIDGQSVDCKFSAGKINTGYFTLPNGVHDISFEIADKQGNVTKMTRQVTVNSDATYPVVSLVGESAGAAAKVKTGGQYNLLINTDQAEKIDEITTTIWLNSASEWALEHATAAKGFSYEYDIDEIACKATITITNDGSALTGEQTLLTIPVYAWAWDGSAGIDAHTQWTSGAPNGDGATCPAVTISYKAFLGDVKYVDGTVNAPKNYIAGFGNIRQDVVTELDSAIGNLRNTIGEWHYHTETSVADKAATCTEDGYTGRTICSDPDCNSIVNWGEVIPATGHTFEIHDGRVQCKDCDEVINGYFEMDGNYYYSVLGALQTGWQQIDNEWYYFDTETYAGLNGDVNSHAVVSTKKNFTFSFENGKLLDGVWVQFDEGWRYYYGPSFYQGRSKVSTYAIEVIDGETYAFDLQGIRCEGISLVNVSAWVKPECWVFDNDGKFIEKYTGLYDGSYYDNGLIKAGAVKIGDDIYYFSAQTGKALADGTYYITAELMNDVQLPAGNYMIVDGKIAMKNGIYEEGGKTYYYRDNKKVKGAVQIGDEIYYFGANYYALDDGSYYISADLLNDLLPAGTYAIEDGIIVKEGFVVKGDKTYYYKDYAKVAGAVQVGDDIYYFGANTKTFLADGSYYISADLMNDVALPAGTYAIRDGIIVKEGLVVKDGKTYYYKDYARIAGAVKVDDDIYYFGANTKTFLADGSYYISADLMNDVDLPAGNYQITGGKIVLKSGLIEEGGKLYYYINNKKQVGAFDVNGDIYYFGANTKTTLADGKYYISAELMNDVELPAGSYQIVDGKIVVSN